MAITGSSAPMYQDNTIEFSTGYKRTTQNRHDDHNHDHDNNNIACARVREAQDRAHSEIQHGNFAQAYSDALSRPMPKFVEREIADMMERGIHSDLILAVIEYTAAAPQPSWAYARAVILRNWARGVNSEEEFLETLRR